MSQQNAQTQPAAPRVRVRPRTDVFETPEAVIVVADLPGADHGTVSVTLEEDVLTLRARPDLHTPEGWQPAGAEFELPEYERSFRVTAEVEREAVEATLRNGRLRILLRKRPNRSNRITVATE
jgi:HSP20 family molecular chaperone IbpA